ncbi:MAG: DUF1934 domain-containing protein [Oscillospiraceae bacterium]|nr:DUF1934 domain-containing protein [Oscillospiraceae bacterium]
MAKNVVISIDTTYIYGPDEEETIEFSTDGVYLFENNVGCLSYYETQVTGMEGTRTSICVSPNNVVVDREGSVNSQMIFQVGVKNSFVYDTPYGSATMGIDTRRIRHNLDEDGGELVIDYLVNLNENSVTRNRFHVTVREMGVM